MRKAQAGRSRGPPKPSCECEDCDNKQCPNLVKVVPAGRNLKIKTIPKLNFGKVKKRKGKKRKPVLPPEVRRPSILDLMNPNRDCGCEVMARAIAEPLHMNLGLTHVRDDINADVRRVSATNEEEEPPIVNKQAP